MEKLLEERIVSKALSEAYGTMLLNWIHQMLTLNFRYLLFQTFLWRNESSSLAYLFLISLLQNQNEARSFISSCSSRTTRLISLQVEHQHTRTPFPFNFLSLFSITPFPLSIHFPLSFSLLIASQFFHSFLSFLVPFHCIVEFLSLKSRGQDWNPSLVADYLRHSCSKSGGAFLRMVSF